jgi:hypothetical protein
VKIFCERRARRKANDKFAVSLASPREASTISVNWQAGLKRRQKTGHTSAP